MSLSRCALSRVNIAFLNDVKTFVDGLLPRIGKFLRTIKDLFTSKIKASLIIYENKVLQQNVRSLLLSLKEGFLKACRDLGNYAVDDGVLSGVKEDRSTTRERLRKYLDICSERLRRCIDLYNDFSERASEVIKKIGEAISNLSDKLQNVEGNEKSHSLWSKFGYMTGGAGIFAIVGSIGLAATAPVTIPAIILLGVGAAGGTAAVGGFVGGNIASSSQAVCKKDIDVLNTALKELHNLHDIMNEASSNSQTCNETLTRSRGNLQSFNVIADKEKPQSEQDTQQSITELSQEEIDFMLKEIVKKMTDLLNTIHTVESDTDTSLDAIPADKTLSTGTT